MESARWRAKELLEEDTGKPKRPLSTFEVAVRSDIPG